MLCCWGRLKAAFACENQKQCQGAVISRGLRIAGLRGVANRRADTITGVDILPQGLTLGGLTITP
jgi:hypothetical protein